MTIEEAKKIAEIAMTADGNCSNCARDLFEQLEESFPEFPWDQWLRERFGESNGIRYP